LNIVGGLNRRVGTNKKLISVASVCFLVTAGFIGFISFDSDFTSAVTTWYVGSGAGNHSTTIRGGIALANPGDTNALGGLKG
jgi:hypothetical protein